MIHHTSIQNSINSTSAKQPEQRKQTSGKRSLFNWFGLQQREDHQQETTKSEEIIIDDDSPIVDVSKKATPKQKKTSPKWWWLEMVGNKDESAQKPHHLLRSQSEYPHRDMLSSYDSQSNSLLPSDDFKRTSLVQLTQQKELLEERVRMINGMVQRMKETKRTMKQQRQPITSAPKLIYKSEEDDTMDPIEHEINRERSDITLNIPSQNKRLRKKKTSGSFVEKSNIIIRKKGAKTPSAEGLETVKSEDNMNALSERDQPLHLGSIPNMHNVTPTSSTKKSPSFNVFDNYFTKSFSNKPISESEEKLPSDSIFSNEKITEMEEGKIVVDESLSDNGNQVVGSSYSTIFEYERQVQLILIDLGFALATFGIPAHRLEYHLTYISKQFGVKPCQIEYTSTGLLFSFSDPIDWTHFNVENGRSTSTTLYITIDSANLSSAGGSLNLDKLYKLDHIADELAQRKITIPDARTRIRKVIKSKPIFNHSFYQIITHLLNSFAWVVFLDGSIIEMITSCAIGVLVGLFCTLAERYPYFQRVNSVINSVVAGIVATILKIVFAQFADPVASPLSVFLVTLCGVFSILPGIQFTTGIAELSTRHLLSGSVRLFSGFIVTLQLGFGVLMATGIDHFLSNSTTIFSHEKPDKYRTFRRVPEWILALVLPLIIVSNIFTFRVPKKIVTYIFVAIISYLSFFVTTYSSYYLGTEVGALLGALVCGVTGNLYAHITKNPALLVTVCGTVLLIPAAFGVRGVKEFLTASSGDETSLISGIEFVFNLLSITVSVTIGLLLGDFIIPTSRKLSF
ncbi:predicted protein [Naegleria gruberi]|uniref:Predicted protein n=1 Tax=Naegleria gruberi TaxID=5762 RepID=D2W060_NAEGR|nr:uncharacterized protein NAEGRDRAFT_53660 [Naegleria gruberi]EFC37560.1 predicted protein [Naegleria gruberi]|eukprot:XP_002670304.1 predicted protein [Naegleria gruberi strain NEG-M]